LISRISDSAWAQFLTEDLFINALMSAEFEFAGSTTPPASLPNDVLLPALMIVLTGCVGSFEVAFAQSMKGFRQLSPKNSRDFNIAQLESLYSIVTALSELYPTADTDAWVALMQNNGRSCFDGACVHQVAKALGGCSTSASASAFSLSDCKSFSATDGSTVTMTVSTMVRTLKSYLNRDRRINKQLTEAFGSWAAPPPTTDGSVSFSRDDSKSSQSRGRSAQPGGERTRRSSSNSSNKSNSSARSSRRVTYNSDACKQCHEVHGVNKYHDARECWVRHPELREEFLRSRGNRDSRTGPASRGRVSGERGSRPRDDAQSDRSQRDSGGGRSGGGGGQSDSPRRSGGGGQRDSSRAPTESASTGGGASARSGTKANVRRVSTIFEDDDGTSGHDDDDEHYD
jgi:hypothetical protein